MELAAKARALITKGGHAAVVADSAHGLAEAKLDLLICIGGDGTILRALQATAVPILGVNTSIVGFLSEVSPAEMEGAIGRVLGGDYTLEERLRIQISLDGRAMPDVANEALLHSAQVGHLRHFHLWVDDELALDANADGLIVATPTGSTGYSLSAGGPLVDPRTEAMVVTAIAPFKLTQRPLVVPAQARLRLVLAHAGTCALVLDGQGENSLAGTEEVMAAKSPRPARFIRFKRDFYSRVNDRLAFKQGLKYHPPKEEAQG